MNTYCFYLLCSLYIGVTAHCPRPAVPENGIILPYRSAYENGSNVTYTCRRGMGIERVGRSVRRCVDSRWRGSVLVCVAVVYHLQSNCVKFNNALTMRGLDMTHAKGFFTVYVRGSPSSMLETLRPRFLNITHIIYCQLPKRINFETYKSFCFLPDASKRTFELISSKINQSGKLCDVTMETLENRLLIGCGTPEVPLNCHFVPEDNDLILIRPNAGYEVLGNSPHPVMQCREGEWKYIEGIDTNFTCSLISESNSWNEAVILGPPFWAVLAAFILMLTVCSCIVYVGPKKKRQWRQKKSNLKKYFAVSPIVKSANSNPIYYEPSPYY